MIKKQSDRLKELLKKLSEDQTLKSAIEDFKRSADSDKTYTAQSFTDFFTYILKMSAGFIGKRKAKAYIEIVEVIIFLISFSIFLKKNLFDRPEVRQFFTDSQKTFGKLTDDFFNYSHGFVSNFLNRKKTKQKEAA